MHSEGYGSCPVCVYVFIIIIIIIIASEVSFLMRSMAQIFAIHVRTYVTYFGKRYISAQL